MHMYNILKMSKVVWPCTFILAMGLVMNVRGQASTTESKAL